MKLSSKIGDSKDESIALWRGRLFKYANYSLLLVIILLLIDNLILTIPLLKTDSPDPKFRGLMVVIMLLLNQLTSFTKTVRSSIIMLSISVLWIILTVVYFFYTWPK